MAYVGLLEHAGLTAALAGGGALLLGLFPRVVGGGDPLQSVSRVLTALFILLTGGGWIALTIVRDRAGLGFMVGLSIAAVAVKWGTRREMRRLNSAGGTPFATMMKRATMFFSGLTFLSLLLVLRGKDGGSLGAFVLGGLTAVWLPAAVAWRINPNAGALRPPQAVAWRATFFGAAITGMVSVAALAVHFTGVSEAALSFMTGVWSGVAATALTLLATAWATTRAGSRAAIVGAGLCLAGLGIGLLLRL